MIYKNPSIQSKSPIKSYPLCSGNISRDFTVDNLNKTGLKGYAYNFYVSYHIIDVILAVLKIFTSILWKNAMLYKFLDSLSKSLLFWC